MPNVRIFAVCLSLSSITTATLAELASVPAARPPVTNSYHGVRVVDDYQWLEESTNATVREWTRRQNERTRAYFAKLPFYDGLSQALEELIAEESACYGLAFKRGDGRVNPAHSRKMTARLQAATSSGHPILLRATDSAGHGMGSSLKDRVAEQADIYAFLFQELGVDASPWTFK
jgi:prolyl oligopeptidase PreP (S9A serine peptidase family)